MKYLKTEKCIICGKPATYWHGHVIGLGKMALGNYVEYEIIAGFCEEHNYYVETGSECGCYGDYNSEKMGKCLPLFERKESAE